MSAFDDMAAAELARRTGGAPASGASAAPASSFDQMASAEIANRQTNPSPADAPDATASTSGPSNPYASLAPTPWPSVNQFLTHESSSLAANAMAGGRTLYDWATGKVKSIGQADTQAQQQVQANTYQPTSTGGKVLSGMFESGANPLNWPAALLKGGGTGTTGILNALGVPSQYSTIAGPLMEAGGDVAAGTIGGARSLGSPKPALPAPRAASSVAPAALSTTDAPRAPYSTVGAGTLPPVDSEPVEGGLPKTLNPDRTAILQRVGLQNARDSAVNGDAKAAATDYQLSRFDEPAGQAAKAQFDAERQALTTHAQGIVQATGGTLGTDEDSLITRGQTISAPFDALRQYFDQQTQQAYAAAAQRANGRPVGTMDGVQSLLKDPDFTETLLARDQGGLLGSLCANVTWNNCLRQFSV